MLIINDTKLAHFKKTDPFFAHYKAAIAALKEKFGTSIVVNYPDDIGLKTRLTNMKVVKENPAGLAIQGTQVYSWAGGDFEVQFASNSRVDTNGRTAYYPKMVEFHELTTIDLNRQPDMAFFYVFASPLCAVFEDKDLQKFQNQRRKRVFYEVYDEAGRAEEELNLETKVAEAKAMITKSTFGIPYEKVVSISIVYGFGDPKNKAPNESIVRKALLDYVTQKDSKGDYNIPLIDQFIEDVNYPEMIELKALIKQLSDNGIIGLEREDKATKYFVYKNGKKLTELCTVNRYSGSPEDSLIAFLQAEPESLNELKEVLEKSLD